MTWGDSHEKGNAIDPEVQHFRRLCVRLSTITDLTAPDRGQVFNNLRPFVLELGPDLDFDPTTIELGDHMHGPIAEARLRPPIDDPCPRKQCHQLGDDLVLGHQSAADKDPDPSNVLSAIQLHSVLTLQFVDQGSLGLEARTHLPGGNGQRLNHLHGSSQDRLVLRNKLFEQVEVSGTGLLGCPQSLPEPLKLSLAQSHKPSPSAVDHLTQSSVFDDYGRPGRIGLMRSGRVSPRLRGFIGIPFLLAPPAPFDKV